jgi:plastocyanin
MKMTERWLAARNAALTMVALAVAGCGGGEGGGGGHGGGGGGAAVENPVDPATAGNVAGRVTFSGTAPTMASIDMSAEPTCAAKHTSPPMQQAFVAGSGGGLANVFVYVREGLEGLQFPAPAQAVVLDQNGCVYVPHVFGVQTGQSITIRNSDGLLHNINASPTENRPFNVSQPVNMETNRSFAAAEVMVPVRCDVHSWMNAYIGVVSHPYHAVSGADGSVSLPGLPPGSYVVEAWHEQFGTLTTNVTVATGETAQISFEFTDAMADAHVPLGEPIDLAHPHGHSVAEQ